MEKAFEESFEKIYQNIYDNCSEKLNEVKSKKNKFLAIIGIVLVIFNLLIFIFEVKNLLFLTISISVAIMILLFVVGNENYRKLYKLYVIQDLVKEYNEKFSYDPKIGISRSEYLSSGFDTGFNEYYSEDRIYGILDSGEDFQIAEVATYEVSNYKNANGEYKEEKTLLFRGMYGVINLKNSVSTQIKVISNFDLRKFDKNRVEVDSSEFEKFYDLITKDKIKAMRIFTADLIEKYIDIVRDNKYGFELKIEDNKIYFRYKCNNIFEPPILKTGLDKNLVKKYYKLIYYLIEIVKSTIENINEITD